MKTEIDFLKREIFKLNILFILAFVCLIAYGVKFIDRDTKLTNKVLEISQKVGVDFSTKTNNLIWTTVQPN